MRSPLAQETLRPKLVLWERESHYKENEMNAKTRKALNLPENRAMVLAIAQDKAAWTAFVRESIKNICQAIAKELPGLSPLNIAVAAHASFQSYLVNVTGCKAVAR